MSVPDAFPVSLEPDRFPDDEALPAEPLLPVRRRPGAPLRFLRHRLALTGSVLLLLVALVSLLAPLLAPYSPQAIDLE
jgi:hypothetical protein